MPKLTDFADFEGRHWETGSVRNALAYQFSESGQALSEAMLMGISGGAAFGYFVFDYKDTDPHVSLLPRNTFDPLDTLLERLAIPQEVHNTTDPGKGERNLIDVLEGGRPAIVWADAFGLPYNALTPGEQMWAMMPILVYGYENGEVSIADRSGRPLTVTVEELASARARVKKDKFRVLALDAPDLNKLPGAIQKGIWQCIALYTEAPPKGGRDNFGFAAYEKLAKMLTNTRNKQSWERLLPPGRRMYAALAGSGFQPGAFGWARTFPSNLVDDRRLYADFLEESVPILNRPDLKAVGGYFRQSSNAWERLSYQLLPDEVPLLRETRELLLSKRDLFVSEGDTALDEVRDIDERLGEIRQVVSTEFPMSNEDVVEMRKRLAELVQEISEIERLAIDALQAAMA